MKISPSATPYETRFSEKRGSQALVGRHGKNNKDDATPSGDDAPAPNDSSQESEVTPVAKE